MSRGCLRSEVLRRYTRTVIDLCSSFVMREEHFEPTAVKIINYRRSFPTYSQYPVHISSRFETCYVKILFTLQRTLQYILDLNKSLI